MFLDLIPLFTRQRVKRQGEEADQQQDTGGSNPANQHTGLGRGGLHSLRKGLIVAEGSNNGQERPLGDADGWFCDERVDTGIHALAAQTGLVLVKVHHVTIHQWDQVHATGEPKTKAQEAEGGRDNIMSAKQQGKTADRKNQRHDAGAVLDTPLIAAIDPQNHPANDANGQGDIQRQAGDFELIKVQPDALHQCCLGEDDGEGDGLKKNKRAVGETLLDGSEERWLLLLLGEMLFPVEESADEDQHGHPDSEADHQPAEGGDPSRITHIWFETLKRHGNNNGKDHENDLPNIDGGTCFVRDSHLIRHNVDVGGDGCVERIIEEKGTQHLDEHQGLVSIATGNIYPEQDESQGEDGRPIADVRQASSDLALGVVANITEQRIVDRVPDAENEPDDACQTGLQSAQLNKVVGQRARSYQGLQDTSRRIRDGDPDPALYGNVLFLKLGSIDHGGLLELGCGSCKYAPMPSNAHRGVSSCVTD